MLLHMRSNLTRVYLVAKRVGSRLCCEGVFTFASLSDEGEIKNVADCNKGRVDQEEFINSKNFRYKIKTDSENSIN